jgi:hypothetical protein
MLFYRRAQLIAAMPALQSFRRSPAHFLTQPCQNPSVDRLAASFGSGSDRPREFLERCLLSFDHWEGQIHVPS